MGKDAAVGRLEGTRGEQVRTTVPTHIPRGVEIVCDLRDGRRDDGAVKCDHEGGEGDAEHEEEEWESGGVDGGLIDGGTLLFDESEPSCTALEVIGYAVAWPCWLRDLGGVVVFVVFVVTRPVRAVGDACVRLTGVDGCERGFGMECWRGCSVGQCCRWW